ncbi:MAG: membrane protein insertase YidC [Clostridia bacterium]|nr:membrane protein insertase YidC [Clostridia bacterium]
MVDLMPNLLMDIISWDTPLWGYLISVFNDFIGNFGWTIIVFTLLLKIILIPLDYFQRKTAKRNAELQKIIQPEVVKIRKKYANVPEVMQQKIQEKQMEIYKNNNYNVIGSCLVMFLNMIITVVVFLTLFNCLNQIGSIETTNMYTKLNTEYNRVYEETGNETKAEQAVLKLYESGDVVQSWLWIDNLWRGDTCASPIPSYKEFISLSQYSSNEESKNYLSEDDYNKVMQPIMDKETGWNGYYILIILSGVITYLSMAISTGSLKKNKKDKLEEDPSAKMTGIMKFILPAIMVIFTLMSNAVFGLYVIANSLFALVTTPIYNKILKSKDGNEGNNGDYINSSKNNELVVDYRIQKNTIIQE